MDNRELTRHIIAALAYRCGKAIQNAPDGFAEFRIGETSRTPGEILAHISDLLDWILRLSKGEKGGLNSQPLEWKNETERFYTTIQELDSYLASDLPVNAPLEKLMQGPILDAFTHTGQIALMRRLAGSPVKGENYFKANIIAGRVGPEQSSERFEFD